MLKIKILQVAFQASPMQSWNAEIIFAKKFLKWADYQLKSGLFLYLLPLLSKSRYEI